MIELGTVENLGFDDTGHERRRRMDCVVECPTCGAEVYLWSETDEWVESKGKWRHHGFDAMSTGECCGKVIMDWWEGTFVLDPNEMGEPRQTSAIRWIEYQENEQKKGRWKP